MPQLDEMTAPFGRRRARALVAAISLGAAWRALPAQQDVPRAKAPLADSVRADLAKLTRLERAYFAENKRYTTDIKSLHFTGATAATFAVSYASERAFSATASHSRLGPLICFVIYTGSAANSPADKPFCTDSRYGTAASALAGAGAEPDPPPKPPERPAVAPPAKSGVTEGTTGGAERPPTQGSRVMYTPGAFAQRLKIAVNGARDSSVVTVQYAVTEARYDPSREMMEVAVERVPLPLVHTAAGSARPALQCFTHPAFVCGEAGLTYIAKDVLHVPRSKVPDADAMRSGLTLQARFTVGRRDDTNGPALTLLGLLLHSNGILLTRWDATGAP